MFLCSVFMLSLCFDLFSFVFLPGEMGRWLSVLEFIHLLSLVFSSRRQVPDHQLTPWRSLNKQVSQSLPLIVSLIAAASMLLLSLHVRLHSCGLCCFRWNITGSGWTTFDTKIFPSFGGKRPRNQGDESKKWSELWEYKKIKKSFKNKSKQRGNDKYHLTISCFWIPFILIHKVTGLFIYSSTEVWSFSRLWGSWSRAQQS